MDPITWRTTHGDTVEVYAFDATDPRGGHLVDSEAPPAYRYRVRAANNRIVEWGESYTRRTAAVKAAERHHPRVEVGAA